MNSAEIRSKFLEFFAQHGHAVVSSSPLVPGNDPTLLFTNSGMVQFKDVFLGKELRPYKRAATSQRCVRAGGKHNDLENVGYTARHHTFFEMLGNFSFGDYFKRDAIKFAWDLLTKVYKLPADKLWVTVYQTDDEAYNLWADEIKVPKERIVRVGDKPGGGSDNFWQMGETGPCGPCSEIFYDHGAEVEGGPPGSPEADGDRYIEIWNLVFMQYNRDDAGKLHPLPKPSVDTGMGLERVAAVLQNVHSNYQIDLFQDLIKGAARVTHSTDLASNSLKVIADHIRACSFLIVDGVIPGNEGRGYVLRRIIRRAIRHGYKLEQKQPFFHLLVEDLCKAMGAVYPELVKAASRVEGVLKQEEERFGETLETGMRLFEIGVGLENRVISYLRDHVIRDFKFFEEPRVTHKNSRFDGIFHKSDEDVLVEVKKLSIVGDLERFLMDCQATVDQYEREITQKARAYLVLVGEKSQAPEELIDLTSPNRTAGDIDKVRVLYLQESSIPLDGRTAFALYDTYGFPFDLTQDLCRERGLPVDVAAYDEAMEEQRAKARAAGKFKASAGVEYKGDKTLFTGYEKLAGEGKVVALYVDGAGVPEIATGQPAIVVLDTTPFYAESGGQVGDRGELVASGGTFEVADTQKIQSDVFGHHGTLKTGALKVGDKVEARVDAASRERTMRNHSVTHLMHKALREVLGPHVQQKGSLVDADKTRFDFAHDKPMSDEEIRRVDLLVNGEIMQNCQTKAQIMSIEEARKFGAMMLFGEKYGDEVRVLDIGSSRELCGGTHVERTGDIGVFKIYSEVGVAAGVRRVEATTGGSALAMMNNQLQEFYEVAKRLRAQPGNGMVEKAVHSLLDEKRSLEKELARLKSKLASAQGDDVALQATEVNGAKVLAVALDGADAKALRETLDKLKDKLKSAAIVLASTESGKVSLIAGVTADLTAKVKAGELVNFVALQVGGKGGGRADMAQAGGTDTAKLPAALASVQAWVQQKLAS